MAATSLVKKAFPRPKFDAAQDYLISRAFILNGRAQVPGNAFDKAGVTPRRLRQLYDQRFLRMAEETAKPKTTKAVEEAPLETRTEEAPRRRRLTAAA